MNFGYFSQYFCCENISVATNSPFCEWIVPQIPESWPNDCSSILHTYISAVHTKTPKSFCKKSLRCLFLTEAMHKIFNNNMWQSYKTMAKKLHKFYSGKFLAKFQNVLPVYFWCNIISQEAHKILHLSVDEWPLSTAVYWCVFQVCKTRKYNKCCSCKLRAVPV